MGTIRANKINHELGIDMSMRKMGILILVMGFCMSCSSGAGQSQSNYMLNGKTLELECDAFLTVMDPGNGPSFALPGHNSGVPASVGDFRKHPDSWMYTDEYKSTYGEHHSRPKPAFRGFVPRGTRLEVVDIMQKSSFAGGPYVEVWVSISDPKYEGMRAELGPLVQNQMGTNIDPQPRKGCLRIVASSTDATSL